MFVKNIVEYRFFQMEYVRQGTCCLFSYRTENMPDILYKIVEFVLYGCYLWDVGSSLTWCRSLVHTINVLAVIMVNQRWCNGTGRNYMNSWVLQLPALNRFRLGGEQQGLSFFLQFTRKSLSLIITFSYFCLQNS